MTMTYTSLISDIQKYLNRDDAETINMIPNFIFLAEQRICRELKHIGLVPFVSGNLTPNVPTLAKPARWLRTLSFQIGTGDNQNVRVPLFLRSYDYLRLYWPDDRVTGQPVYYGDYDVYHFLITPTPDQAYNIEISYYEIPEPLGPTVSMNWLTMYVPQLLLYASLIESSTFLKVDQRTPYWQSIYDRSLASLNHQDEQRIMDRQSDRKSD